MEPSNFLKASIERRVETKSQLGLAENGKYYAFLTSKNLYSNASFTFNKEFGEQVLQAIGPYCINK